MELTNITAPEPVRATYYTQALLLKSAAQKVYTGEN
jgi:hypothetical protein